VDLALHLRMDLARRHDPRAFARERVAEGRVADVGGELVKRLFALALDGLGRLDPMALLVLVLVVVRAPAHVASIRPRPSRPQGPVGQPDGPRSRSRPRVPYSYRRMVTGGEKKRKASLPATVGAWLKVWTPPRDVEVAPPPSARTLAIAAVVLVVLVAGAAALIVPAIDSSKERS